MLYAPNGRNEVDAGIGRLAAAAAVLSGRPYFGVARPWVWAIDIDTPSHPAVATLRALLDSNNVDYIEADSGSGLHVFAHLADRPTRDRIWQELLRQHVNLDRVHHIDRRDLHGGTIRPPLAPSAKQAGGWSEPKLAVSEALEIVEGWAAEHRNDVPSWRFDLMRPWVQAYLTENWAWATMLGKAVKWNADGRPDRSWVDHQLALGFRNHGYQFEDFLNVRGPGGSHPSPKATDKKRATDKNGGAERYLRVQWDAASKLPERATGRTVNGQALDSALDAWLADVEASPMKADAKRLMHVLAAFCRQYGKVAVDLSIRDLNIETGLKHGAIKKIMDDPLTAGFACRWAPVETTRWRTLSDVYWLVLSESPMTNGEHTNTVAGVSVCVPRLSRGHRVFHPSGLGPKAYETLLGYIDGRKTATEAWKHCRVVRGDLDRRTFTKYTATLVTVNVLVVGEDGKYSISPGADWDALAVELGVEATLAERRRQASVQRAGRKIGRQFGVSPRQRAEQTGGTVTEAENVAWHQQRHEALASAIRQQETLSGPPGAAHDEPEQNILKPSDDHRLSDNVQATNTQPAELVRLHHRTGHSRRANQATTETTCPLMATYGLQVRTRIPVTVQPTESVAVETSAPPQGRCVCCGYRTTFTEPTTGWFWHSTCRLPHWVARSHRQTGLTIPDHLVKYPTVRADFDPYQIDPDHSREAVLSAA